MPLHQPGRNTVNEASYKEEWRPFLTLLTSPPQKLSHRKRKEGEECASEALLIGGFKCAI